MSVCSTIDIIGILVCGMVIGMPLGWMFPIKRTKKSEGYQGTYQKDGRLVVDGACFINMQKVKDFIKKLKNVSIIFGEEDSIGIVYESGYDSDEVNDLIREFEKELGLLK